MDDTIDILQQDPAAWLSTQLHCCMAVSCNDYGWKASFLLLSYADLAEDQRVNDDG